VNDDSTGGLSEDELIDQLKEAADPKRPVRLILIGMGPDVDASALERVATSVDECPTRRRTPATSGRSSSRPSRPGTADRLYQGPPGVRQGP
jgi:hypothetical protein